VIGPKVPRPTPAESRAAYAEVRKRAAGICEGCGAAPATEFHHRIYRSRGGLDTVVNLLHLCGWGNHTGCHGIAHTIVGAQTGWSVHGWNDPALVPVFNKRTGLWTRGAEVLNPINAVEYMLLVAQMK